MSQEQEENYPETSAIQLDEEAQFVADALQRVRSPLHRYWLTLIFDAAATIISAGEQAVSEVSTKDHLKKTG